MVDDSTQDANFAAIQRCFVEAIVAGDDLPSRALADIRPGALSAERRLAIYRHNVVTNLTNALADLYPVIHNIVDAPFFREAARIFILSNPSVSGNLNDFGGHFGAFLRTYPPAAELPYLADVAALEWNWHCAFHAADGDTGVAEEKAPLISRLGALAPEDLPNVHFVLAPSVCLVRSTFPLFTIWQVNQPDYVGDWDVDWARAEMVVLYRDGFEVAIRQIDSASFAFLQAVSEKKGLAEALETALNEDAEFNLQGFLLSCVQSNIIIDFWTST